MPTHLVGIGGATFASVAAHFPASDAERGAYLGLPTLLIAALFAGRVRRSPTARFLLASLGLAAFATLGTKLLVEGHVVVTLPSAALVRLPLFDNVLPVRFAAFTSLAAAVIVALWAAPRRDWSGRVLPALAVASLVPAVWHADYRTVPERWPFFSDGLYRACIPRGENVAIFPYGFWGNSMLWQAESGFWFRMAEGYLRPKPPPPFLADPTVTMLTFTTDNPKPPQILAFARHKHVDRIVSVLIYPHPSSNQMHRFGAVQLDGGVLVAPACGYPSLQTAVTPTSAHPATK